MTDANPQELTVLARFVLVMAVALIVAGIIWHGFTAATFERFWHNLVDRPTGPMKFRFVLQPSMAAIAAIHDGLADARAGRSPYLEALLRNQKERAARLREGWNATARIILLGLVMDIIYQVLVLKTFYPNEAVVVALLLAFVPYVIIRGLMLRLWRHHASGRPVL